MHSHRVVNRFGPVVVAILLAGRLGAQVGSAGVFRPAGHEADVIRFDSPLRIDWRSLAPSDLEPMEEPEEALRRWDALEQRRNLFDSAEFAYEAPVPPGLADMEHYLIGPTGIARLDLDHLAGTVRFRLDRSLRRIEARLDYGNITARSAAQPVEGGGFVLSDPVRVPREAAAAELTAFDLVRGSGLEREPGLAPADPLSETEAAAWTILRQYGFTLGDGPDAEYAFIQWQVTGATFESSCLYRYSIVALRPYPRILATNAYGCDV